MRDHPFMQLYLDVSPILAVIFFVLFVTTFWANKDLEADIVSMEDDFVGQTDVAYNDGLDDGYSAGKEDGYQDGFAEASKELPFAKNEGYWEAVEKITGEKTYGAVLNATAAYSEYMEKHSLSKKPTPIIQQAEPGAHKYVDPRGDAYQEIYKNP